MNHDKINPKQEHSLQAHYVSYIDRQNSQKQEEDVYTKKFEEKLDEMKKEINGMAKDPEIFKNHQLPLARIKKIMKSDQDVRMISSETPVLFAKACEIFIVELTHRAWAFTEESKRRTLQKSDIAACIQNTEIFDFLIDIIPKEDLKQIKKPEMSNVNPNVITSLNQFGYQFNNNNKK